MPYEINIYLNREHGFDGLDGDPRAAKDARERTPAFFDKHLASDYPASRNSKGSTPEKGQPFGGAAPQVKPVALELHFEFQL